MRSAQRKARLEKTKTKNRFLGILFKIIIPLTVVLFVFLYIKLNTRYWDGESKVSFVFQTTDGNVSVTILDPKLNEETTLIIPGDTQVDVARGYGTIRLKNVWQLGVNEGLEGGLLPQTLTKNFLFPTNLWSDTSIDNVWKFVFSTKKTNIPFGDRLMAGFFVMRLSGIEKTEIDLVKSQFLHKKILVDGQSGYVISGPATTRLTVYFSDNKMADKNIKFSLVDLTGSYGIANNVGSILEVLGGKVVAVDKKSTDESLDCEVFGKNKYVVKKVGLLFSCKEISGESNFDVEMIMGSKFAKRF